MTLPAGFLDRPFAHRALHGPGKPENSREAVWAAVEAGYGIELDVQRSRDNAAMVFHDYGLKRLLGVAGTVQTSDLSFLAETPLIGGPTGAPTLKEVLDLVAGRVPVLIEIKDQDGAMGPNVGPLERAVADALVGYDGPVAVMSFNPHSVAAMAEAAPEIPRGLTTAAYLPENWPTIPAWRREELALIPDYKSVGACFISHDARTLTDAPVLELAAQQVPVLCWTVRSAQEESEARKIADQVTFEGYYPA